MEILPSKKKSSSFHLTLANDPSSSCEIYSNEIQPNTTSLADARLLAHRRLRNQFHLHTVPAREPQKMSVNYLPNLANLSRAQANKDPESSSYHSTHARCCKHCTLHPLSPPPHALALALTLASKSKSRTTLTSPPRLLTASTTKSSSV